MAEMKDPIGKFIEGAEFLGVGKSLHYDVYEGVFSYSQEIYEAAGRFVAIRRFPVYRKQSFWDAVILMKSPEKIGEDYESEVISKDEAFEMLVRADVPIKKIADRLAE